MWSVILLNKIFRQKLIVTLYYNQNYVIITCKEEILFVLCKAVLNNSESYALCWIVTVTVHTSL